MALLSLLAAPAAALLIAPAPLRIAARASAPMMGVPDFDTPLGYQTEGASSKAMVDQLALEDNIMMLRLAASRCAEEKNMEAQRALMHEIERTRAMLKSRLKMVRRPPLPSARPPPSAAPLSARPPAWQKKQEEKDLSTLLRAVEGVRAQGSKVYGFSLEAKLNELKRLLGS